MSMQSTAEKVLSAWTGHKKHRDGGYRGNCPYRAESDSGAFALKLEDGEHGAYIDHATKESGSLYDLANKMGIETPLDGRVDVANTKTPYKDLADYAARHFAPIDVFQKAGWRDDIYQNRKAILWKTDSGTRARFIDDDADKSVYRWVGENRGNCWYGLSRAIRIANSISSPIVLCNGEASTVTADYHGIPAFCGTGGEGSVSDAMLKELENRWQGQVIIALDCDERGRSATDELITKIGKAIPIDLGLGRGGDLADFCGIHNETALSAIRKLASKALEKMTVEPSEFIEFVDNHSLLSDFQKFIHEQPELFGRVVKMPFNNMRLAGGFADMITTKKVWFTGNISGGGKTIFSETLCDGWNTIGHNVIYIGDEWSPMEFIARSIQRASRSNVVPYMDYLRYVAGEKQFSDDEEMGIAFASRAIRSRQGKTYVMKVRDNAKQVVFLEDIMSALATKIETLRANGIIIDVVVLDYLSLYDTRESSGNNIEEYKAGIFKSWCKSLDVLGVSTVQVNKASEDRVIQKGGLLTQHDLYWIRPDKGNLISTMNRMYKTNYEMVWDVSSNDKNAHRPYLDDNGQPLLTPNVCIVTAKNSVASAHEFAYFHFDFNHMCLREGLAPGYEYRKDAGMVLPVNWNKSHTQKSAMEIPV